ncbi:Pup--protein ligase [Naumannella cuiyingiana]|uniref:Pup--protein ligase n=1 Tax=Naumannella cuiyingiana TaxID=1347891 RepID=UPI0015CE9781|nr:Pup--protein ligase [Naumannella cuiyingiana]
MTPTIASRPPHPRDRRIFGVETEYGVSCTVREGRRLTADEIARALFRTVVAWGKSSNVFLRNGSRVYLDVGSHPEYATAECDDPRQLVAHDRAGERILHDLAEQAAGRLVDEGIDADIYLFKNNSDSHGNSYGCHENYLVDRTGDFSAYADVLVPFLVSRQLICGAGKVQPGGAFSISQRAEHMWDGVSSATTRCRPMINTRDEPHADPERYRRLHVIVGDSNLSQTTTLLKIVSTDLVLRLIESGTAIRDLALENPIRAIRDIATDVTGRRTVVRASGQTISGLELQQCYLEAVTGLVGERVPETPEIKRSIDLWRRCLTAIETGDFGSVETEIDWVIKRHLIDRYAARHGLAADHPRLAQLDLAYHDIAPGRGLFRMLEARGDAAQVCDDVEVAEAIEHAPATTRARLRGAFIEAAQQARVDYTVDWVHLKINDQVPRAWATPRPSPAGGSWANTTVLCKDPFAAHDDRVDRLIASMRAEPGPGAGEDRSPAGPTG